MKNTRTKLLPLLYCLLFVVRMNGQVTISLRKSFVDSINNRATVSTNYKILFAHDRPNRIAVDGDLHASGYDNIVGLASVIEIMNAAGQSTACGHIQQAVNSTETISITGAWRLWFEHPQHVDQTQGTIVPIEDTNPAHVFEIHPITNIQGIDISSSLVPIKNDKTEYAYKTAENAFSSYDKKSCKISAEGDMVLVQSSQIGDNYVKFKISLLETPLEAEDGFIVHCKVLGDNDTEVEASVRMIFIKNSAPANSVKLLGAGDKMEVLGIPRVCLNEVVNRLALSATNPDILNAFLPYEMIIVAQF
jgi:hypothetical protein